MTGVFAGSGCSLAVGFDSAVSLGSQCGLHGGSESTSNSSASGLCEGVVVRQHFTIQVDGYWYMFRFDPYILCSTLLWS